MVQIPVSSTLWHCCPFLSLHICLFQGWEAGRFPTFPYDKLLEKKKPVLGVQMGLLGMYKVRNGLLHQNPIQTWPQKTVVKGNFSNRKRSVVYLVIYLVWKEKQPKIKIYMGCMSVMNSVAVYFGVWKEKDQKIENN